MTISDIKLSSYCSIVHKHKTVIKHNCDQTLTLHSAMEIVSFHILLFLVKIHLASELEGISKTGEESHVGHLMKTKSGKVFLRSSSKKAISPKKDTEEGGRDISNDDEIKVTGNEEVCHSSKLLFFLNIFHL